MDIGLLDGPEGVSYPVKVVSSKVVGDHIEVTFTIPDEYVEQFQQKYIDGVSISNLIEENNA